MGTLGKAAGVAGRFVEARASLIDLILNCARSFIYSTAPPPALAVTAEVALQILSGAQGDRRRERLWQLVRDLTRRLSLAEAQSAIVPWVIGEERAALACAQTLQSAGFYVPAIRYPTVAKGSARLRFTVTAAHKQQQIDGLVEAVLRYRHHE